MRKRNVFAAYSQNFDMTFIVEEIITKKKTIVKVVGFYYGEPDTDCTRACYGKNKAVLR